MSNAMLAAVTLLGALSTIPDDPRRGHLLQSRGPADLDAPPRIVDHVNLSRFVGVWYEVARLPDGDDGTCGSGVKATYSWSDEGTLGVVEECRRSDGTFVRLEGVVRRAGPARPASELEVSYEPRLLRLLPFAWADHWILHLAPDYSFAVVGGADRRHLRILVRSPEITNARFQEIVERLANDYDLSRLTRTPPP